MNDVFMITYENWVKDRWRTICFTCYHLWIKGFEEKWRLPFYLKIYSMAYKSIWLWWEGGAAQEFLTLYNSYLIQVAWYMVDASSREGKSRWCLHGSGCAIKWKTILWYIRNYLILMANKIWVLNIIPFSVQLNLF